MEGARAPSPSEIHAPGQREEAKSDLILKKMMESSDYHYEIAVSVSTNGLSALRSFVQPVGDPRSCTNCISRARECVIPLPLPEPGAKRPACGHCKAGKLGCSHHGGKVERSTSEGAAAAPAAKALKGKTTKVVPPKPAMTRSSVARSASVAAGPYIETTHGGKTVVDLTGEGTAYPGSVSPC